MTDRPEHPKPQFQRENWTNLNGLWSFAVDSGESGSERGWQNGSHPFGESIRVPFCPQSKLSGIENRDFMRSVWYRRTFPVDEKDLDGILRLHFGAVDYRAEVYINGERVGVHSGGYTSFWFDIQAYVKPGENTLTVHAQDDERDPLIPSGKQCPSYASRGCHYTRTTGIWQTVWLERIPLTHIESVRIIPSPETGTVTLTAVLAGNAELTAAAFYEGRSAGSVSCSCCGGTATLTIPLSEIHLWEIGCGRLYTLELSYGTDRVESYFGLRSLSFCGKAFLLNGKPVFQRLILDQGFYPDGIYTAPTDSDLAEDIRRAQAMGFNGARLHQKIFEERFLYHADRLGYLVWAEYPSWGLDLSDPRALHAILSEWLEEVRRDFNHPSIIGWCPLNETNNRQLESTLRMLYEATKLADPTRPCIDTSGYVHVITDCYDVHDYEQDPDVFRSHYENLSTTGAYHESHPSLQKYDGSAPFFVSEYGGVFWSALGGWGYGKSPQSEAEYLARLRGLTDALLDNPAVFGFCYTQLTDVEQEQNGLYTYERAAKFPPHILASIFGREAAVERT
ncbi:MAG: beta-galactosidase [Clostridia bacterium]|nr:beta-galactosidase [Clostridia bacterium]